MSAFSTAKVVWFKKESCKVIKKPDMHKVSNSTKPQKFVQKDTKLIITIIVYVVMYYYVPLMATWCVS